MVAPFFFVCPRFLVDLRTSGWILNCNFRRRAGTVLPSNVALRVRGWDMMHKVRRCWRVKQARVKKCVRNDEKKKKKNGGLTAIRRYTTVTQQVPLCNSVFSCFFHFGEHNPLKVCAVPLRDSAG